MTSNITRSDRGIFSTESTGGVEDAVKKQLLHSPNSHTPTSTKNNSNGSNTNSLPSPPLKKKRSLPGNPDPSADVIALSPNTLITTNRFICEICNKGFQREQNLQLHRRGHNLPWKLKQKTTSEVRKRVYVCPEPSCVHHNPARALGDLTGIKKHFSRKHGEKKWKCEKCCKKYAVLSDWKAHSKTCGTKEYKCDCGTIFSRKESFIAHRAFCDAISEKNNKLNKREYFSKKMGSNLQAQPIPNPNNTPSHAFELSQNSLNMLGQYNGLHPAEGPPQMSATALLQKVSQIGTTVTENNEFVTSLAPPSYGIMNGFTSSQECDFDANGTMSRLDMFNAILDQSKALSKIIEENNNTNSVIDIGGSKGSEDVMTLDFLGIGGGGGGTCGNLLENVGSDGIWRNWSNENLGFESFSATTSM